MTRSRRGSRRLRWNEDVAHAAMVDAGGAHEVRLRQATCQSRAAGGGTGGAVRFHASSSCTRPSQARRFA